MRYCDGLGRYDFNGFVANHKQEVLAMKPCPVQVNIDDGGGNYDD